MKIHTTQNLDSLVQNRQSTNYVSSKDFRLKNYSEQVLMPKLMEEIEAQTGYVSFGKKVPNSADGKKLIKTAKKVVGNVRNDANPKKKRGDKFVTGSLFDNMLKIAKYETSAQAAIAALICMVFRPATIMSIPTKKSKEDNIYASSHSIASGLVGLVATVALTTPFRWGADHVTKVMLKDLNETTLKRLYPQLDLKSIVDSTGKRLSVDKWLNEGGKAFCKEIKDVMKLPEFTQLDNASQKTFENVLGIKNINWASQKGKSFNDVTLTNGEKLYDKLDWTKIGIVVEETGMKDAQILLRDINKDYLTKIIKDAPENSNWKKLDIESVYENNQSVDFRKWKDKNGNQWKLDLDSAYVASPYETASYKPRITGTKRYDAKDKEYKFRTYQKNGEENGSLGTEINDEMLKAESRNEGHMKLLTWLPDLAFRIPIAATTIALIPIILKNVFGVEKGKKKDAESDTQKALNTNKTNPADTNKVDNKQNEQTSFKGGKDDAAKKGSWFVRKFGEWYGKPLLQNEKVAKVSEKLSKVKGGMTELMATFGSLITSSVYVQRTLTNKDLDPERRRTLAINQVLCFFIPTIAAYSVNNSLKEVTKKVEYRYAGWKEREMEIAKLEKKILDNKTIEKDLGTKLKGVRILSSLATFTLIYRYATPVVITPIANWLGGKLNAKKREQAKEIALENKPAAKEISIDKNKNTKQVA